MKPRHLLMLAGVVGAAWLALFGDKMADTELASPVVRQPGMPPSFSAAAPSGESVIRSSTRIEAESQIAQGEAEVRILALQSRSDLIGASGSELEGDGLFSSKSWTPPLAAAKLETPPPPTAPPLPFTYLGKQTSGGRMEVYLASGDKVLIVRDQAVIQNTYRVESIKPPTLSLVYLPLNQIQRLSIGVTN